MLPPLFVGFLCLVILLLLSTLRQSSFAERVDCFSVTVFLVSCDNQCSVVPWVGLRCVTVVFPDHFNDWLIYSLNRIKSKNMKIILTISDLNLTRCVRKH